MRNFPAKDRWSKEGASRHKSQRNSRTFLLLISWSESCILTPGSMPEAILLRMSKALAASFLYIAQRASDFMKVEIYTAHLSEIWNLGLYLSAVQFAQSKFWTLYSRTVISPPKCVPERLLKRLSNVGVIQGIIGPTVPSLRFFTNRIRRKVLSWWETAEGLMPARAARSATQSSARER